MSLLRAVVLVALSATFGCSAQKLELFVDVQASLAPGSEFDHVVTELFADETMPALRQSVLTAGPADDFVMGRRVAEFAELAPGSYTVHVTLSLRGTIVRAQSLLVALQSTRAVTIAFDTPCSGAGCPEFDGGMDAAAADGGAADAPPPDAFRSCEIDEECDDGTFCNGADTCELGVCVHAGDPCSDPATCNEHDARCDCDDGNACTDEDYVRSDGACAGSPTISDRPCTSCSVPGACGCCAGSCVPVNENDQCGSCSLVCMPPETCMPSPSRLCGWAYCCGM
jgi:hypothetical protein